MVRPAKVIASATTVRLDPNLSASIGSEAPLLAYFEVYHLRPDAAGQTRFDYEYAVRPLRTGRGPDYARCPAAGQLGPSRTVAGDVVQRPRIGTVGARMQAAMPKWFGPSPLLGAPARAGIAGPAHLLAPRTWLITAAAGGSNEAI